jgi:thiol-disulfide isomerase/thioredoxin
MIRKILYVLGFIGLLFTSGVAKTELAPTKSLIGKQMPTLPLEEWLTPAPNFQNKWVLVEVWETWCGYCQKFSPRLNTIQASLGKKLAIVAVSNEDKDVMQNYIKEMNVKYPVGRIQEGIIAKQWGVRIPSVPHVILTNPQGEVVWTGTPTLKGDSFLKYLKQVVH